MDLLLSFIGQGGGFGGLALKKHGGGDQGGGWPGTLSLIPCNLALEVHFIKWQKILSLLLLGSDKGLFSARDPSAKEREGDKEIEKSICIDIGIKRKINS